MNDPRSSSFLSLTTALAGMESPPTFIILENVKVRGWFAYRSLAPPINHQREGRSLG